jgi:Primase C terminal 2 (PriCT-2)
MRHATKSISNGQLALAELFDSDPEVCDLPRVMRPPGTWHQKGEPFQSRIHALNPEIEYTEAEFQAALAKARGQRPAAAAAAAAARSPFAQNHAPILPAVQGGLNEKYDKDPPPVTSDNVAWVREMLAAIPVASFTELVKQLNGGSKKTERDYWLDIGRALHWGTGGNDTGRALYVEFSRRYSDEFNESGLDAQWKSFHTEGRAKPITLGTLIHIAKTAGWIYRAPPDETQPLIPVQAERMVEYLIEAAFRKRLQVIFTTHSEYAA